MGERMAFLRFFTRLKRGKCYKVCLLTRSWLFTPEILRLWLRQRSKPSKWMGMEAASRMLTTRVTFRAPWLCFTHSNQPIRCSSVSLVLLNHVYILPYIWSLLCLVAPCLFAYMFSWFYRSLNLIWSLQQQGPKSKVKLLFFNPFQWEHNSIFKLAGL